MDAMTIMMLGALAFGGAQDGATMHSMPGVEMGLVKGRVQATFSDGTSADRLYRVAGAAGDVWMRVACRAGAVSAAYVVAPRDAASGMASGKRMHKPFVITMELGKYAAGGGKAQGAMLHWDLATAKGARAAADGGVMGMDDWQQVSLHGTPRLCD